MTGILILAFGAGVVASVNPCGFAFLPIYLAHRLNRSAASPAPTRVMLPVALASGAFATAGFIVVFGVIGTVVAIGGNWLLPAVPWAGLVIGAGLLVAGLYVLFGGSLALRLPVAYPIFTKTGPGTDFLFGIAYGTGSVTCTLPVFLSLAGLALSSGAVTGALSYIAFALGMGAVLTALAVFAALSSKGLERAVKDLLPYTKRTGGLILAAAGAYLTYYWVTNLAAPDSDTALAVSLFASRASSLISVWIGDDRVQAVLLAVLAATAGFAVWHWRRRRPGQ